MSDETSPTTGTPPSLTALAARIPGREVAMLTEDASGADAYEAALAYCEGAARRSGRTLDWSLREAVEALRFRLWFELYAANEGETVASDKRRRADELLAQVLGDAATAPPGGDGPHALSPTPAGAVVKQPPRSSRLDGFPH